MFGVTKEDIIINKHTRDNVGVRIAQTVEKIRLRRFVHFIRIDYNSEIIKVVMVMNVYGSM